MYLVHLHPDASFRYLLAPHVLHKSRLFHCDTMQESGVPTTIALRCTSRECFRSSGDMFFQNVQEQSLLSLPIFEVQSPALRAAPFSRTIALTNTVLRLHRFVLNGQRSEDVLQS